jgi:iron complex outermembrane receptor protein
MTLLAGGHGQTQNDVDGDGWADLPGYARGVFRPRFFWDGGNGRSFFATAGVTYEDRTGGTVSGRTLPATGAPYREAVNTLRVDFGAVGQTLLQGKYVLTGRVALAEQKHDHQYGDDRERDRHQTGFAEVSLRGHSGRHTWVGGAALDSDGYRPKDVRPLQYTFTVPGLLVHDEIEVKPWFSLSASGRVDWHSKYGAFFSPRISVLLRSGGWSSRISAGVGFFGPSPLTEETEAAGLARLVIPRPLRAERSQSASLDVTRRQGPASVTFTLFASRVRDPLYVDRSQGLTLTNLADPTTNLGGEFLGTLRHAPWSLTGTYTLVRSLESPAGRRQEVPLSPRHSAGLVGTWEKEKVARIGVEWYYTGEQRLEENPYRGRSQPYFVMGFLGERRFGPLSLFVNGENLTGVKQSHWDPLLRPSRAADGRWTVDAWAPLEGRNINGGIRVRF